jgi:acetyl esterase/lipase
VSTAFFAVSLVGAAFTLLAVAAPRRPSVLSFPFFMAGWLTGELAALHLAWQLVATIVFVALGALSHPLGWAGLGVSVASWVGLVASARWQGSEAAVLAEAMGDADVGDPTGRAAESVGAAAAIVSRGQLLSPFRMRRHGVRRIPNLAYGEHRRNRLDVYVPPGDVGGRPVVLQIHGGAWVVGNKAQQGQPLLYHLAERGWVGVAPNYRLSPRATFPDHLVDVKRALAWVRRHGAEYGADPDTLVVTGGSAGGHLAALMALTPNDPQLQPGFEDVDTTVTACVPMYGVYDFLDQHGVRGRDAMRPFLERVVMKCSPEACPELWKAASPISLVRPDAPPFFVVHGGHDSLAWVEDTRFFVEALRAVSHQPVVYAELPHAQHAFDVMYSVRTAHVIDAITRWLERVRAAAPPTSAIGGGVEAVTR